jgi:F0F1-type ATP synthase membrane subunit b/b'
MARDSAAYETALRAAREKCERLCRQGRENALAGQTALLARANRQAADHMREERERLLAEHRRAQDALAPVVRDLADAAAARLLA